MAWPVPGSGFAAYQVATGTYPATAGRDVDSNLWAMMLAENLIFNEVQKGTTTQPKFEWEYSQTVPRLITAASTVTGDIGYAADSGARAANTSMHVSTADAKLCQVGTILKNATRATLIGSLEAQMDELLIVTVVGSGVLTLTRDAANINSGTGFATHGPTDQYEIIGTPLSEGSLASDSINKYKAVGIASNEVSTFDFKIEVTGDMFARGMLVAKDNMQEQYENRFLELRNQLASMMLYGYQDPNIASGYDSPMTAPHVRTSAGLASFLCQSGGNVDYSSTVLTATVINNLFRKIRLAGGSQVDDYAIIVNPARAQTISSFGEDKVRTTQDMTLYGREITQFKSDLGFVADIVDEPMCSPGHMFIVNKRKWQLLTFRPFSKWEWGAYTAIPNGDDVYHQRTLGSVGLKVVDPLKAHAACLTLGW